MNDHKIKFENVLEDINNTYTRYDCSCAKHYTGSTIYAQIHIGGRVIKRKIYYDRNCMGDNRICRIEICMYCGTLVDKHMYHKCDVCYGFSIIKAYKSYCVEKNISNYDLHVVMHRNQINRNQIFGKGDIHDYIYDLTKESTTKNYIFDKSREKVLYYTRYECEPCSYSTKIKTHYERHKKSKKHKKLSK